MSHEPQSITVMAPRTATQATPEEAVAYWRVVCAVMQRGWVAICFWFCKAWRWLRGTVKPGALPGEPRVVCAALPVCEEKPTRLACEERPPSVEEEKRRLSFDLPEEKRPLEEKCASAKKPVCPFDFTDWPYEVRDCPEKQAALASFMAGRDQVTLQSAQDFWTAFYNAKEDQGDYELMALIDPACFTCEETFEGAMECLLALHGAGALQVNVLEALTQSREEILSGRAARASQKLFKRTDPLALPRGLVGLGDAPDGPRDSATALADWTNAVVGLQEAAVPLTPALLRLLVTFPLEAMVLKRTWRLLTEKMGLDAETGDVLLSLPGKIEALLASLKKEHHGAKGKTGTTEMKTECQTRHTNEQKGEKAYTEEGDPRTDDERACELPAFAALATLGSAIGLLKTHGCLTPATRRLVCRLGSPLQIAERVCAVEARFAPRQIDYATLDEASLERMANLLNTLEQHNALAPENLDYVYAHQDSVSSIRVISIATAPTQALSTAPCVFPLKHLARLEHAHLIQPLTNAIDDLPALRAIFQHEALMVHYWQRCAKVNGQTDFLGKLLVMLAHNNCLDVPTLDVLAHLTSTPLSYGRSAAQIYNQLQTCPICPSGKARQADFWACFLGEQWHEALAQLDALDALGAPYLCVLLDTLSRANDDWESARAGVTSQLKALLSQKQEGRRVPPKAVQATLTWVCPEQLGLGHPASTLEKEAKEQKGGRSLSSPTQRGIFMPDALPLPSPATCLPPTDVSACVSETILGAFETTLPAHKPLASAIHALMGDLDSATAMAIRSLFLCFYRLRDTAHEKELCGPYQTPLNFTVRQLVDWHRRLKDEKALSPSVVETFMASLVGWSAKREVDGSICGVEPPPQTEAPPLIKTHGIRLHLENTLCALVTLRRTGFPMTPALLNLMKTYPTYLCGLVTRLCAFQQQTKAEPATLQALLEEPMLLSDVVFALTHEALRFTAIFQTFQALACEDLGLHMQTACFSVLKGPLEHAEERVMALTTLKEAGLWHAALWMAVCQYRFPGRVSKRLCDFAQWVDKDCGWLISDTANLESLVNQLGALAQKGNLSPASAHALYAQCDRKRAMVQRRSSLLVPPSLGLTLLMLAHEQGCAQSPIATEETTCRSAQETKRLLGNPPDPKDLERTPSSFFRAVLTDRPAPTRPHPVETPLLHAQDPFEHQVFLRFPDHERLI